MTPNRTIDFRYAPRKGWTCIGRPDDPFKSLVTQDGELLYGFEGNYTFRRVLAFRPQTDLTPTEVKQWTESARVPIVHTQLQYPKATFELRTFGHQHDGDQRTDVVLWRIRAAETLEEGILTGLWLQARELARKFIPPAHEPSQDIYAVALDRLPKKPDVEPLVQVTKVTVAEPPGDVAFVSAPYALQPSVTYDFGPASALKTEPTLLLPGQEMQGAIIIPLNHEEIEGKDLDWALDALQRERQFWEEYNLQPYTMELPDDAVADMVTAAARNILQAREIKDGLPEFQVGPAVYRGLWVVDGHFLLEAARYLGHHTAADQGIKVLLRRVRPSGAIEEFPYHSKETGIALATLVRQSELTGRMEGLRELWPTIQRAVAFIESLREESKKRGPESPEYGLMPRSFGDGGLGGLRAEYTTTLWTLVGLKQITRAAHHLGYDEDAERFQASFDDLLRAFREHAERDLRQLDNGLPYLSMVKPGSGDHNIVADFEGQPGPWQSVNPGTATWALAHAIYPGEVFTPDDPLVANFCQLLDLLDDQEDIPAETGWLPYRSVWSYAASFYAHVWLYAGRPEKAIDYLYGFANHAYPTRVWREEQSFRDSHHGQLFGDMPHNWASAEFIRLIRHLLILERGETLELLPGLPHEWLVEGKPIHLERTPTRFGPVNLRLERRSSGEIELDVQLEADWPLTPERCLLHLSRLGRVQQVTLNGQEVAQDTAVVDVPFGPQLRLTAVMTAEVLDH